ncbi:hypothetical protein C9J03_04020 [Photobacterium gaetbulicola]|uniref:Uncharacterized protein n=2 Tax=Photobacterium gaetbulicola TaxID=1295392 RepID=A0A0C5W5N2_9GAMM|nr:hypothetical protein [Photobacterium gaetbulicola]AJR06766.1 hypothetical protein H744_1c1748 [Photobacterium gaetbulicola Gung47]KHT62003.1 hypothetical protein RJ45_19795 [Photobacterium gaetbulicola]PSU14080.1 hypothetical protein C9J03_04020 [Photobacterium gaetbulicola]
MSVFDLIAENQIQDYNRRKANGEVKESRTIQPEERTSFESHLFKSIVGCYEKAAEKPEQERQALEERAENLRMQLLIGLEQKGMRITAQSMSKELMLKRQAILGNE